MQDMTTLVREINRLLRLDDIKVINTFTKDGMQDIYVLYDYFNLRIYRAKYDKENRPTSMLLHRIFFNKIIDFSEYGYQENPLNIQWEMDAYHFVNDILPNHPINEKITLEGEDNWCKKQYAVKSNILMEFYINNDGIVKIEQMIRYRSNIIMDEEQSVKLF